MFRSLSLLFLKLFLPKKLVLKVADPPRFSSTSGRRELERVHGAIPRPSEGATICTVLHLLIQHLNIGHSLFWKPLSKVEGKQSVCFILHSLVFESKPKNEVNFYVVW